MNARLYIYAAAVMLFTLAGCSSQKSGYNYKKHHKQSARASKKTGGDLVNNSCANNRRFSKDSSKRTSILASGGVIEKGSIRSSRSPRENTTRKTNLFDFDFFERRKQGNRFKKVDSKPKNKKDLLLKYY